MDIVGRLTADAKVTETKNGNNVVNFTVAVNDRLRLKSGEMHELVTYFNCAYWFSTGIAKHLLKGQLVEAYGRISSKAWITAEGEAKSSLDLKVLRIKLHGKVSSTNESEVNTEFTSEETPF